MIYIRLVLYLIIILISAASGWYIEYLRYDKLSGEYINFQEKVKSEAEVQEANTKVLTVEEKSITTNEVKNEKTNIDAVHKLYVDNNRVRLSTTTSTSSSNVPQVPTTTIRIDGNSYDPISVAQDCANETVKLLALQQWVNDQYNLNK